MRIKFFIIEEDAFIECADGYLVCIGSREALRNATPQEIGDMVDSALALAQYKTLETEKSVTRH